MADEPIDRDALAAELALGLLDGEERAVALRLRLTDPDFAAEVDAWQQRLAPLLNEVSPVAPPSSVWDVISARLGSPRSGVSIGRLRFWQGAAVLSGAVAASLAMVLVLRPLPSIEPPPFGFSQLADNDGAARMAIAYDPRKGELRLETSRLGADGKRPELWVIPEGGAPRSLGMIRDDGGSLAIDPAVRPLLRGGATLAITLEDAATGPHAAPTSAPILIGKITII